jgi:multiple sugar transport system ATP-binding protein
MNLVHATVDGDRVRFGQFHLPFADGRAPHGIGRNVVLGIRPEAFEDAALAPGLPTIRARIEVLEELGSDVHLFFHVDAAPISAEILEATAGGGLPDGRALFTARVDAQTTARVGDSVELAVDSRRFHFFDPDTGARLSADSAPALAEAR